MARDPIMALVADQHTARKNFFLKFVSQTRLGTAAHKVSGHTFFYKPFQSFYTPFSVLCFIPGCVDSLRRRSYSFKNIFQTILHIFSLYVSYSK